MNWHIIITVIYHKGIKSSITIMCHTLYAPKLQPTNHMYSDPLVVISAQLISYVSYLS